MALERPAGLTLNAEREARSNTPCVRIGPLVYEGNSDTNASQRPTTSASK